MRHLRSILYALVLAPAVWILSGVGFTHDLTGRARDSGSVETVTGLLLLLLAGAAYGILLFAPISPAGPVLFGVVYVAVGVWALAGPGSYADLWPSSVAKPGFDLSLPGYGLAVLLAVPLIGTALSARRWDGYEPPQIPLIGTLGRTRGAATVSGSLQTEILTPYAAEQADPTQVIKLPGGATTVLPEMDATQVVGPSGPSDRTQVIRSAAPDANTPDTTSPDATQVVGSVPPDATQVVGSVPPDATQVVEAGPEPDETQIVEASSDEPTEVSGSEDAEADTATVVEDDAETMTVAMVEDDAEPATVAVVQDDAEPATVAVAEDDAEPVTVAVAEDSEPAAAADDHAEPATVAVSDVVVAEVEAAEVPDDVVTAPAGDSDDKARTELIVSEEDDRTELVRVDDEDATAGEPVTADTAESPVEEPVVAQAESEAEEAAAEEAATTDEPVAEETAADESAASEPAAQSETAENETAENERAENETAENERAENETAENETAEAEAAEEDTAYESAADVAAMFEKLNPRVAPGDDDQERTQVIRLPAGELVTHDLRGRITPVMPPPDDRPTRVINRGALRGSEPGERTQVIRMPQKPEPAKPGPAKPGPAKAKPPTAQPPKPEPARTKATDEAERTQVIRLGAGTVDPPDERTQVIKLPARTETRTASRMEEEPAEKTTPKGPSSVMGAERPNFAEDPTTRLMPPRVDDPDAENGNSRTMTVTNLERPADELADDLTRPLVPGPRSPESDQS